MCTLYAYTYIIEVPICFLKHLHIETYIMRDSMHLNVLRVIDCFYDKSRLNTVDCYIISARIYSTRNMYNILLFLYSYSDSIECCYLF